MTEIEREIKEKYLKAPTLEEVKEFISYLGVTVAQFEVYYGIPKGVVYLVMFGERNLPVKFWPIIYERIVPTYGLKYTQRVQKAKKSSFTRKLTKEKAQINSKRLSDL